MRLYATVACAAIAAALAVPGAAEAKAKAHRHHATAAAGPGVADELALAQQQIAMLTAQVNALQAKMDAPAPAAAVATSHADAALAQAQAAQAQATTALAHADAAARAAAHPIIPDAIKWAADTKVGGTIFFDVSNLYAANRLNSTGASTRAGENGTGINVKRIYVTLDHTFNKTFSANITLDAANVVGSTSTYANTNAANDSSASAQKIVGRGLFVKYAYVQAKLNPLLTVRVGAAPTAWIPFIDGITGTRYVDQNVNERNGLGNSADWGVYALGDLGKYVSYQVGVVNGAGYRKLYVTKDVDVDGRISANYKGLFAAVGGLVGHEGSIVEGVTAYNTYSRINGAVGYKSALFTLGGEYVFAKNLKTVASAPGTAGSPAGVGTEDKTEGFSVFGKFNFTPKLAAIGRYDWVKYLPNENATALTNSHDHFFFAGLQYEPYKFIDLTLLYKRELVNSNGGAGLTTFDVTPVANARTTYDEVGLFGQVKF